MQIRKQCAICGNNFVASGKNVIYCSRVCYREAGRRRNRKNNVLRRKGMPIRRGELPEPEPQETFDLMPRELIEGPDKNKDDKKTYQFRVTNIYRYFFEAERIDRKLTRSFTKADYLTGVVKRIKESTDGGTK